MNSTSTGSSRAGLFWPFALLAAAFLLLLSWNLRAAVRQRASALRARDQQAELAQQANRTAERMRLMIVDLVQLAETDPPAKAIMRKHGITYTPPPAVPRSVPPQPGFLPAPPPAPQQGASPAVP